MSFAEPPFFTIYLHYQNNFILFIKSINYGIIFPIIYIEAKLRNSYSISLPNLLGEIMKLSKKIMISLLVMLITAGLFSCKTTETAKKTSLPATDWFWEFQTLPANWANNKFFTGSDIDYGNNMSILASKMQVKMCPQIDPPELESTFSPGFIQPITSGEVLKITNVIGPVTIKVYYTGTEEKGEHFAAITLNGKDVTVGPNSPDTKTEKLVTASYNDTLPGEVIISTNNSARIFDVKIIPAF